MKSLRIVAIDPGAFKSILNDFKKHFRLRIENLKFLTAFLKIVKAI